MLILLAILRVLRWSSVDRNIAFHLSSSLSLWDLRGPGFSAMPTSRGAGTFLFISTTRFCCDAPKKMEVSSCNLKTCVLQRGRYRALGSQSHSQSTNYLSQYISVNS